MLMKILRSLLTILGMIIGSEVVYLLVKYLKINTLLGYSMEGINLLALILIGGLLGGIILHFTSVRIINLGRNLTSSVEKNIQKTPANDILVGIIGLLTGLVIAFLVSSGPIKMLPFAWVGTLLSIIIYALLGYLGVSIATKKREDLFGLFFNAIKKSTQKDKDKIVKNDNRVSPKILDTSVIIDGRIADICKTGFVEGPLVIPSFVLEELRHIADSSDSLKRNRGRRGLDILNRIQKEFNMPVEIIEKDFEELSEVDTKLLKLAQVLDGSVVTNDYNLNKVAEFQRVSVLNINELANAVKPVVLPGEEMIVTVIKDGKESGQGIAYLDDGTMIVVDGGKKYTGETINVIVTSVLQTAAGRMIFVKLNAEVNKVS